MTSNTHCHCTPDNTVVNK